MDWNEYVDHLRESRAFMRRQLAKKLVIEQVQAALTKHAQPDMVLSPDDVAKFAEDTAQALMVRLAAREEAEIAAGKMGATA